MHNVFLHGLKPGEPDGRMKFASFEGNLGHVGALLSLSFFGSSHDMTEMLLTSMLRFNLINGKDKIMFHFS